MLELAITEQAATLAHVLKQKALELRPRWWGAGRLWGGPRAGQTHVRLRPDTEKLSQSHRRCTCSAIHNQGPDSPSPASRSPQGGFSAEELRRSGVKRGALLELLGSLSVFVERAAALPASRTVREGVE